jgi:hypothetical protein
MTLPEYIGRGRQVVATQIGTEYTLTFDITAFNMSANGVANLKVGTAPKTGDILTSEITGTGSESHDFTALTTVTYLTWECDASAGAGLGDNFNVDNISILTPEYKVLQEGGLAQLIKWEAQNSEVMRLWLRDLAFLRDPYKTPYLDELQREFGETVDETIDEDTRRNGLAATVYANPHRGSDTSLQSALDRMFPDLFTVYQNEPPQDPADLDGGSTGGRLIVNGRIFLFAFDWFVGAGEARAQCGNSITGPPAFYAQAGEYLDIINNELTYTIPTSPDYWHLIFFVGGYDTTSNLLIDGNMDKPGISDYTVGNSAILTKETSGDCQGCRWLKVTSLGSAFPYAEQTILTAGNQYRVRGRAKGDGTRWPYVGTDIEFIWTGTSSTSWQEIDEVITVAGTKLQLVVNSPGAAFAGFDNIEVHDYLVVDGNMEAVGTTAYTAVGGATLSKETDNPAQGTQWLKIFNTLSPGYASQAALMTVGEKYSLRAFAKGDGFSYPKVFDGVSDIWVGTTSPEWQSVSVDFTAQGTSLILEKNGNSTGFVGFDDVWLRANEPIGDVAIDGDMEASGVTDWGVGNSAALTKETTDPYRGAQLLRVAFAGIANPYTFQDVLIVGEMYRAVGFARSDGTKIPIFSQNSVNLWTGTTSTDWQRIDVSFTAAAVTTYELVTIGTAGYTEWDDIRVWKVRQSIDRVDIPSQRRSDFERAVLKIKPLHSWCMAFVGYDLILNGTFDDDSEWTLGTDWSIASGKATKASGAGSTSIVQSDRGFVTGKSYEVNFVVSDYTGGTITPIVGATGTGTARSANGQYQEVIVAVGSGDTISFQGTAAFGGSIYNVVCIELGD